MGLFEPEFVDQINNTELTYGFTEGSPGLRKSIASIYSGATIDNVQAFNGSAEANMVSIMTLIEPGDEMVYMMPNYLQIYGFARGLGANLKTFQLHESLGWKPDLDELRSIVSDKTKLISIDMGVYDPLTGKSNSEIAALSRSQHKSQGFGSSAALGSRTEYLSLVLGKPIIGNDPFEGINTRWTRVKGGEPIEKIINEIITNFDLTTPLKSIPKLLEAKDLVDKIEDSHWRTIKLNEIKSIILKKSILT